MHSSTVNKWKSDFKENGKYLEFECENDIVKKIWCSVCRLYGKDKTAAFSIGTSNLKKETVKKHFQSGQHADTLKLKIARQCIEANTDTEILKRLKQMEKGTEEKMIKKFSNCFPRGIL